MNDRTLNSSLRWSNLAKFGQSKLGQLTLIVPALGYLIFFNSFVDEHLRPLQVSEGGGVFHRLSAVRLELLYLGLVMVGLSVACFGIFAPQQIKDHKLFSTFMRNKLDLKSDESVRFSIEKISYLYTKERNLRLHRRFLSGVHLPRDYAAGLEKTLMSLWLRGLENSTPRPEANELFCTRLSTCQLSLSDIEAMRRAAVDFPEDVFRYEYILAEFVSLPTRVLVYFFFVTGALVSVSPTLVTSILVMEKLFEKASL